MKVLITGGAGHLGANLVRRLLADGGVELRVLARREEDQANRDAFAGLDVDVVYGDLRNLESLRPAVQGIERIFHCAAQISTVDGQEQALFENNVIGTKNL